MADAEPPAPPVPPAAPAPQAPQAPQHPIQLPIAPDQPVPAQPIQHMPQLTWSHFKPELSGKPEKDAEAHLLRINDWMDKHAFPESVKVLRFCLNISRRSYIVV